MACGHGGNGNFVEGVHGLPPVHFLNLRILRDVLSGEARADAERDGKSRMPLRADATQSGQVKVIVVVVALQNQINRRNLVEMDTGRAVARRSNPGEGAGAMRPDGIAKNVQALELDQEGGMADEGDAKFSIVNAFGWSGARQRVNPFAPRRGA